MRPALVTMVFLAAACTEPPRSEALDSRELALGEQGFSIVPDGAVRELPLVAEEAPVADPGPVIDDELAEDAETIETPGRTPRIIVSGWDRSAERDEDGYWADGTARCPFSVSGVGFPAVRTDGSALARISHGSSGPGEGEDEHVSVETIDVAADDGPESTTLVDGSESLGTDHCWRWYKRARKTAAELNETFATGWRSMERLPVQLHGDGQAYGWDPYPFDDPEQPYTAHTRPVQLTWMREEVVLRVPGVRVLARATADWQVPPDDPSEGGCWYDPPAPTELWVDRATGVGALKVEHISGPCYCESWDDMHTFAVPAEALAEIDRRNRAT